MQSIKCKTTLPMTYTLDSGDEIVGGSVLAYDDVELKDGPREKDDVDNGPLTLAVALTMQSEWIPVFSIDGDNGSNWIRPSAATVRELGCVIDDRRICETNSDLKNGQELFRHWARIIAPILDLNCCIAVEGELENLAEEAAQIQASDVKAPRDIRRLINKLATFEPELKEGPLWDGLAETRSIATQDNAENGGTVHE